MSFWEALFEFAFLQRALATSVMVGIFCGVIGCYIVLRGLSLMGDAISHAVLPGVALSYMLKINLFYGAVGTGLLTALGIGYVQQNTRLKSDTAIGIVFSAAFALGVILITLARASSNLHNVLFGNLLAIPASEMWITLGVGVVVLAAVTLFHKELLVTSFDPTMAAAYGLSNRAIHYLLMVLLTLVTVAALQTVGIVLVVAMLITPAATAFLLTKRLQPMLWLAAVFGVLAALTGLYFSYVYNLPSGPVMVLALTGIFLLAFLFSPREGQLQKLLVRRRRRLTSVTGEGTGKDLV